MSRKSDYCIEEMRRFKDRLIQCVSSAERLREAERAESLLAELDSHETYLLAELCHRIKTSPLEADKTCVVSGKQALHDLRLLIEDLSDSVDLRVEMVKEPVLTVQDVSRRFNVSTKTVDRWRSRGLVSRRFLFGKRKRVGFLQSSVERFATQYSQGIRRGSQFTHLSDREREQIITRARQLDNAGHRSTKITKQLASEFGRSPETVRLAVQDHNRQNPQAIVLSIERKRLSEETKRQISHRFCQGEPLGSLARFVKRSPASVKRIIDEMRLQRLYEQPIDFIYNRSFGEPDAEQIILGPPPEVKKTRVRLRPPSALPAYLASLYEVPLLTRQQELYFFRKMNYLKFRSAQLRDELNKDRPRSKHLDHVEQLLNEAIEIRNLLIRRNLRLVISIAKKFAKADSNVFELVSDGNVSLMRAVDKFDYSRGFKLSTYATWAIKKNFTRTIPAEFKQLDRFRTGNDELFDFSQDTAKNPFEQQRINVQQRDAIWTVLKRLVGRDREIIEYRFGLDRLLEPLTLQQLGDRFGVSKERIRQLEARALNAMRDIVNRERIDIPGI